MAKMTTLKEFEAVFPKLEEALLDHARQYKLGEYELEWYKRVGNNLTAAVPGAGGIAGRAR